MTSQPFTIRRDATMAQADQIMKEHQIRHLPVLDGGKLVGVVSARDLNLIGALPGSDPATLTVEEAMVTDVYAVDGNEAVDVVVDAMAQQKVGSVVIVNRRGGVDGIFTATDALAQLAGVLRRITED